jgi:transmembrane sensor
MGARLPLPIREVLDEPIDARDVDAAWKRHQLRRPRSPAVPLVLASAAALAVAAVALLVIGHAPGPLRLADGAMPTVLHGASEVTLSDGSQLAMSDDAHVALLENDGQELALLLGAGSATFDVVPGGPRRWTIECGLATVVVVGTRFRIERTEDRLTVSVSRGAVLVRGERVPDGARRLGAGESIVIERESEPERVREAPAEPLAARIDDARAVQAPSETTRVVPSAWRPLAARGAYDEAYAQLGPTGLRRATAHASAEDLLVLADVARLSGHPPEAIAPLEQLLAEHASDPNAALAAFTLGRIEADDMDRPARAAQAFERATQLALPRALLPDALARLADARHDAGDDAGARQAAQRYLDSFPEGPLTAHMRALSEVPR